MSVRVAEDGTDGWLVKERDESYGDYSGPKIDSKRPFDPLRTV